MHSWKGARQGRQGLAGTVGQAALLGGLAAMIGSGACALPLGPANVQTSNGTTPTFVGDPSAGISAVNLSAPRTVLDWNAFAVNPGETVTFNAQARSDIVLNRLPDFVPVQINGTLQSLVGTQTGGNVWFSAPGGVFFGPTAVVNVGGLMATTASLLDLDDFLDPTKSTFTFQFQGQGVPDPTGANPETPYYGGVRVQSGAKISTAGGLLALVAPFVNVDAGATVGDANTGDVLLGGASGYTITLGQETAGDLDLLEYQVPVAYAGADVLTGDTSVAPAVTVAGAVTGKNVFVTALSLQGLTNAIVTDNGSLTATGAVQQGDGSVILTADTFDLVPASFPNGSVFDPTLGVAPAGGSNQFLPQYATPLSFGNISAPQTYIHAGGLAQGASGTTISGAAAQASAGDIALAGADLTGSLRAVAEPLPAAQYIQATPPAGTVSASADLTANDIDIQGSGGAYLAGLTATGGALAVTSDTGSISTGAASAAGDLTLTAPAGGVGANALSAGGALAVTADSSNGYLYAGDLTAGRALTVNAYTVSAGQATGQSVTLASGSGGYGVSVGDVTATGGPVVLADAGGYGVSAASVTASGPVTVTSAAGTVRIGTDLFSSDLLVGVAGGPVTGRSVTLSGYGGVRAGDVTATGGPLTASAVEGSVFISSATAAGAVDLTTTGAPVQIGTDVYAADGITVTGFAPGAVTGQSVALSAPAGAVTAGTVTATGDVDVAAITIAADAVNAGGAASLTATPGAQSAPGSSGVTAGALSATSAFVQAGDGTVAITSASIGSGGLQVHALGANGDIYLGYAAAPSGGGTGSLAGTASLYADGAVNVDVSGAANLAVVQAGGPASLTAEAGDLALGTVTVGGALAAASPRGSISLAALDQAGPATLSAGSDITITSQLTAPVGSALAGRDLTVNGAGALDLTGFGLSAGRDVTLSSPGLLTVPGLSAVRTATLSAGDLALTGALTAPTVTIASLNGLLTLGGSGTGTGLVLDAGEVGRIGASGALNLYAGAPSGTARGDLMVQDLAIDPARVPNLNLYAAAGHTVRVDGLLAPATSGGAVTIGGSAGWTPTTILVGGGLGAATHVTDTRFTGVRAFDQLSLNAGGDILLGSPRFIGLAQAAAPDQINQGLDLPAGAKAQGSEIGRVYLASGRLAIAAGGKVVGQNTSGAPGGYSGVWLTNTAGAPGLVLTLDPPSVVDLFGSYVNRTGATSSGPTAAVGPELKVLAGGDVLNYRFNGCTIGVGCGGGIPGPAQGLQPLNGLQAVFVSEATDAGAAAGASDAAEAGASSTPGGRVQAPTFGIVPSADADPQADPVVTGTGNEEIWRKRGGNSQ